MLSCVTGVCGAETVDHLLPASSCLTPTVTTIIIISHISIIIIDVAVHMCASLSPSSLSTQSVKTDGPTWRMHGHALLADGGLLGLTG